MIPLQTQTVRAVCPHDSPDTCGMVVTVDRRGRIFVDQASFAYGDFRAGFRALVSGRRPTGVYLRADRGAPYGDVVRVLAVIRASGVQNVGLVTEQEDIP